MSTTQFNIYPGDSFTIGFVIPESYDMGNYEGATVEIGGVTYDSEVVDGIIRCELSSDVTQKLYAKQEVILSFLDADFGVKKLLCGYVFLTQTKSTFNNTAVNDGYNVLQTLTITETTITSESVLYDVLRVKSAYELAVEGGYEGTEEQFNLDLADVGNILPYTKRAEAAALSAEEDAEQTGLDRVQTGLDRVQTTADAAQTALDAIATAADRVQTGLDKIATNADAVQTALDRIATGDDAAQTALDRIATGEDRTQTGLDAIATSADRVQTGLDATATAGDRVQTGLDVIQTGADVILTATDVVSTEAARDLAEKWAENPEDVPVETGKFSALHWAAKAKDSADEAAATLANKLDKTTATDVLFIGLYKAASVVQGAITVITKMWTWYNSLVTAASGAVFGISNTEKYMRMAVDNNMWDSIEFGWLADAGSAIRTSTIYRFFTKLFNLIGSNDATQATSTSQPYQFFDGGMKNVNTDTRNMQITAITKTNAEAWTLTARLNWYGTINAIAGLIGKQSDTLSIFSLRTASANRFTLINEAGVAVSGAVGANNGLIGKFNTLHLIATGTTLGIYINNVLIETLTVNTGFVLSSIIKAYSTASRDFHGNIKGLVFRGGNLTLSQRAAEHTELVARYPEIESVTIGSQIWSKHNSEMVATPMGNVIQEMQLAANVEMITNAADREFSSDTGTWNKGAAWAIGGGYATKNDAVSSTFNRSVGHTVGKYYRITIKVDSITGLFNVFLGGTGTPNITATGTYSYIVRPVDNQNLFVTNNATFIGQIDNISVKELGWSNATEIYDAIYAATAGTAAQKTTAALRAAAMWRYPNTSTELGAVYGKIYNKYALKLMAEDIAAWNTANPTNLWGYAVPTRAQLTTLSAIGGNAAKIAGTDYWTTANGTNTSGLSLLGSGYIDSAGAYQENKATTLLLCSDADFARKVVDADDTFAEVAITTEGGILRLIKV